MLIYRTRAILVLLARYYTRYMFRGNYSTLDSHTNTVISHAVATICQDGFKTLTRLIQSYLKLLVEGLTRVETRTCSMYDINIVLYVFY